MTYNILTTLSIKLIKKIWHGKIGRKYNHKNHVLCRFYPSCSNYAILALEEYGFVKGWIMSYKRVKRCTPFNTDSCIDFP